MLFILNILLFCSLAFSANWYAAPTGSPSGDGSLANPWDLTTAFNLKDHSLGGPIQPGDVLYLRGGRYQSPGPYVWWPTLTGVPGTPIVVRSYPGDSRPAIDLMSYSDSLFLDNPLRSGNVVGHNVHDVDFWDIEFYSSTIVRASTATGNNGIPNGLIVEGVNVRLIHPYMHDIGNFATFASAFNSVVYGGVLCDMGWIAPDRGHGHLMYIENDNSQGSVKTIQNNFAFSSYDDAVQEFGTASLTRAISFLNNTVFNGGGVPAVNQALIQWMIGQNVPTQIITDSNFFYTSPNLGGGTVQMGWPWDTLNGTGSFTNNWVVGPSFSVRDWANVTVTGNKIFPYSGQNVQFLLYGLANPPQTYSTWTVDNNTYGMTTFETGTQTTDPNTGAPQTNGQNQATPAAWKAAIGGDAHSNFGVAPSTAVLINPSTFIPGRVHITVWNPAGLTSVPVNLSSAGLTDGAAYSLFDAQNFGMGTGNGPVVQSGTYSAASPTISVPATGLPRKVIIGYGPTTHTAPYLLTFILESGQALNGTWNPIPGAPLPPLGNPTSPPVTTPGSPTASTVFSFFTATPTTVAPGQPVTYSWNVTGAVSLSFGCSDGTVGGAQPGSKTVAVTPKNTTGNDTCTLTAVDGNGVTTTDSVTVAVQASGGSTPPPATSTVFNSFTATPITITAGSTVSLSWNVSGAVGLTLACSDGLNGGGQPLVKTATITPKNASGPDTCTLSATDGNGIKTTDAVTISVTAAGSTPPPTPPPSTTAAINSFSGNANAAGTFTFTWNLSNAGTVVLASSDGLAKSEPATSTGTTITPFATSGTVEYVLLVIAADSTIAQKAATLTVVPPAVATPPPPTNPPPPSSGASGPAVFGTMTAVANSDGTVKLTWVVANCNSLTITSTDGTPAGLSVQTAGSAIITPASPKGTAVAYILNALGTDGSVISQRFPTITVQ